MALTTFNSLCQCLLSQVKGKEMLLRDKSQKEKYKNTQMVCRRISGEARWKYGMNTSKYISIRK